jgi:hypothetical protein
MTTISEILDRFPHPPTSLVGIEVEEGIDQSISSKSKKSLNDAIKELYQRAACGVIGSKDREEFYTLLLKLDQFALFALQMSSSVDMLNLASKGQKGLKWNPNHPIPSVQVCAAFSCVESQDMTKLSDSKVLLRLWSEEFSSSNWTSLFRLHCDSTL